jgi:hypothetical protein
MRFQNTEQFALHMKCQYLQVALKLYFEHKRDK